MAGTEGSQPARGSQSQKAGPSSDWSLQLDSMKPESLVIVNQPSHGEYVLGSCTHNKSAGQYSFLESSNLSLRIVNRSVAEG